jgi:hypothetical protein
VAPLGRLSGLVLECPDPGVLAAFYSRLTDWPVTFADEDWASIGESADADLHLSFQRAPDHRPPTWPDPASSMQAHLHLRVADLDEAERVVLEIGGSKLDHQPDPESARVFADPAGHPFCLVPRRSP